jgi:hypothetical protein
LKYFQDIARLLHIAATSLSLLTVPQADPVDNANGEQLPDGEERAEMFVQEATKYYETLNVSEYTKACYSLDALVV